MTTRFTASNGVTITPEDDGFLFADDDDQSSSYHITSRVTAALRAYFTAERDSELGRWRDPENPNKVVYPAGNNGARILCEIDGASFHRRRDDHPSLVGMDSAARYFAANPEPRPWEDAAEDDIWLLDGADHRGTLKPYQAVIDTDGETIKEPRFFPAYRTEWTTGAFPREFTAGRRIWPTEESDDE